MSTTKKHDVFVSVPMRHKSVNEVPGIGKALGDRCIENNISQARDLLGEFLIRKMNPSLCVEFMRKEFGANTKHAADAFNAMQEWCRNFL